MGSVGRHSTLCLHSAGSQVGGWADMSPRILNVYQFLVGCHSLKCVELNLTSSDISGYAEAEHLEVGHAWELPGYRSPSDRHMTLSKWFHFSDCPLSCAPTSRAVTSAHSAHPKVPGTSC